MSRRPMTCGDCARRKIKCDKNIPCNNCVKRGCADLCKRAEVTHTTERQSRPTSSLSPGAPSSLYATPRQQDPETPINERILTLVTTLSERVKHLEAKLDGLEPRKRDFPNESGHSPQSSRPISPSRPFKQAKTSQNEGVKATPHLETEAIGPTENESGSVQNSSDAEIEDAATVLEFLAWGRLKDSNLTSGVRDVNQSMTFPDKDVFQSTQAWHNSPSSIPTSQPAMETLQMSQIQEMLPTKTQVMLLFDYHANWLLFMHCSFHVPTFRRELDQFYQDNAIINMTSAGLQWAALLFAILCGSMTCAKPAQIANWGFHHEDQAILAKNWYHASIECLNIARYQQNHNLYSIQTITSSTICAHILGFSNSQSVLLASAVRIAHSLGLHRLSRSEKGNSDTEVEDLAASVQKELSRRLWQELAEQDWFSVPFSETYCVNPLHFITKPPLHLDEETMQPVPLSSPTITSYGSFLYRIACFMPFLQDRIAQARTINSKYEQVLHVDKMMRDLVLTQMPPCLNGQTALDPSWPKWVFLARRNLTITSAHKIIMIHRRFLGMSFRDSRFAFTRKTCLAAAKTIINEVNQDYPAESPVLWTMQAFSVAAGIILSLDNFNRHQSAHEYAEHRQLVSQTIENLSTYASVSSIASRGTRLLTDLLAEEQNVHARNNDPDSSHESKDSSTGSTNMPKRNENSLNVAAFVKKFCESDDPPPGNSPIAMPHVPLWLQESSQSHSNRQGNSDDQYFASRDNGLYQNFAFGAQHASYEVSDPNFQVPLARRQNDGFANAYGQTFGEPFDIRSVTWFDDLLGLAPSHSI